MLAHSSMVGSGLYVKSRKKLNNNPSIAYEADVGGLAGFPMPFWRSNVQNVANETFLDSFGGY